MTTITDGTPHLTYFAESTAFSWTGRLSDPIEVSPGGYGEPVVDTIEPIDVPALRAQQAFLPYQLVVFKAVCDTWLAEVSV